MGVLAAIAGYGVCGILLAIAYYRLPDCRENSRFQILTLLLVVLGAALALSATRAGDVLDTGRTTYVLGVEGYLFLCAATCHLPTVVFILLSQWNRVLERLTSPGARGAPSKPRTAKEEWALVEGLLAELAEHPIDAHRRRQLAEAYLRLGLADSAIGEFRKATECLDRGYEQAHLLFRTAQLLLERKGDVRGALPLLRRIVRLYPRSYFAAYARRELNHHESRQGSSSSSPASWPRASEF